MHTRLRVTLRDAHLLELLLLLLVLGVNTAGFTDAHTEDSPLPPWPRALLAEPLMDDKVVPEPEKVRKDSSSPGRGVAKSVANSTTYNSDEWRNTATWITSNY